MTRTRTLDDLAGSEHLDSRDLRERLAALERYADVEDADILDEDEREELDALRAIDAEGSHSFPDWPYGVALVREDRFPEHAQQLAEDIGAISSDAQWPLIYIDWDAAADALKQDYTKIQIGDYTYLGR